MTRTASIEPVVVAVSGVECAAVSCNRGSAPSSSQLPAVALAGLLSLTILVFPLVRAWRRSNTAAGPLAAGVRGRLLRPPQLVPAT